MLFLALSLVLSTSAFDSGAQSLVTDKLDYAPGTMATFTGAGFAPGELVRIEVTPDAAPAESWVVFADETGSFVSAWEVCYCPAMTLRATADGLTSGLHAECFFTDATMWTLGIAPTSSAGGQTQSYVLTANNTSTGGGNQMGCITITIPSQFTPVGSPSVVPGSTTHSWSVNRVGQVITAIANSNGDRINEGESIQFSISATAPTSTSGSPFAWTSVARTNTNCTGASFGIPDGGHPRVAVTCSAPAIGCPGNITVASDPGLCSAVVNFAATATGSPAPAITYSQDPGTPFPVGTTLVTAIATSSCGSASCSFTVTVVDHTPPAILLAGANPVTVECHGGFSDPGASASDNCPGAIPVNISGAVDVNTVGSYILTYSATDASGNPAAATRTVNVVDTASPLVTLVDGDLTLECHGAAFSDPGASASDACAGSLPVSVAGSVDVNTVGDYVLVYSAVDPSGNPASASRTVHVVDTTDPIVTLVGGDMTLECHGPAFSDPGASASDACAGSLPVSVAGSVDVNTVGDYVLVYNATDPSGNPASASRTVHVVDTTNPIVALVGGDMTLECHGPAFSDPGASASDACAGSLPVNVSGSVDVNTVGDYVLVYSAIDPSGNPASASRTVHVVDTTAPVIGSPGASATIECPETPAFVAPTAVDACDPNVQVVEVSDVTVPGACPGAYERTKSWKAVDAVGNSSATVSQTIAVVDTTPPALGLAGANGTVSCPASPVFTAPLASDACDPSPQVIEVGDVTTPGPCAGAYSRTKTWQARDCSGNLSALVSQTIEVIDSTPAVAAITGPANGTVVAVGAPVSFTGVVSDECSLPGAQWQFDSIVVPAGAIGAGGAVSTSYTFSHPGVYQLKLVATDACGNSSTATQTPEGFDWTIIVYDPNGGFVTGGGWIQSPAGAYRPNVSLQGKANFGFVSKYQKGARVPTGETEFQFKAGDLNFHSSAYEWLVIGGAKAQYRGVGAINGAAGYGFLLTGVDGAKLGGNPPDRFRVKIWDQVTGDVIYDNQFGQSEDSDASTALGGGSIVVHSGKGGTMGMDGGAQGVMPAASPASALPVEFALHAARPNPFAASTAIGFDLPEPSQVSILVYDVRGRKVATMSSGRYDAGTHAVQWAGRADTGERLKAGIYFARFVARSTVSERRLESMKKLLLER